MEQAQPIQPTPPSPKRDGWGIFLVIVFLIIFSLCNLIGPILGWLVWETAGITGITIPNWIIPSLALGFGLILVGILWLFGAFWRRSLRYRAVFQTWALAALFTVLMVGVRTVIPVSVSNAADRGAMWQIGGAAVFLLIIWALARRLGKPWSGRVDANRWPAFFIVPLVLGPFFMIGSLGSPLDFIIQLVSGTMFGLALGRLWGSFFLPSLYQTSQGPGRDLSLNIFVLLGALLLMGPAYGLFGQTILMLLLPIMSILLAVSMNWGQPPRVENWLTLTWVSGLITAGMFILTDADELNMFHILEPGEIFIRLLTGAGIAAGSAFLLGILFLFLQRPMATATDPVGSSFASAFWFVVMLVYATLGSPGFHGDRLFVVMADQVDVSQAENIADLDERRAFVYNALSNQAQVSQAELISTLERFNINYESYYLVNGLEVEGGPIIRLWLNSRSDVDRVMGNFDTRPNPFDPITSTGDASAPSEVPWNLSMIGADRVWEEFGVRGEGVVVGNSDSGVQFDHPELADSYRGRSGQHSFNWFDPWTNTISPVDYNGHGTHTMGSVLGNSVGVAPDAEWIGCANLQRPLGSPGKYLACLEFMLAPFPQTGNSQTDGRPDLAADVLNNSWGCPPIEGCDAESLEPAVDALRSAGIFVVVSAGNDGEGGCETVRSPLALYDSVFSVGAVDQSEDLASFSSRGPVTADGSGRIKPDIVAPGVSILSAFPDSTYAITDGTSMSGPHVAGVVALIWSANPDLMGQIDQTEQIIQQTARPLESLTALPCGDEIGPDNLVGYGLVDVYEAVKLAIDN